MPLSAGQKLAAYEIVSALGAGGMGEVYRARDSRLGREVALKILPPEVTNEPGRLERFDREARAIAALNHPHIVTIYSTEEAEGIRFLTMELVDGCTLSDLVMSSGMAMPRFLEIAIPLADALAAAHQKQITHRDLKPGNVMVSNDGRVKVLDFGLARVGGADVGEHSLAATQAPITHQGMIVGTMPYMSPEQVEGRPLDPRSDLFSLGVIFYELLSGDRPFKGSSSPALMSAILRDTPSSVCEKRPELPEALDRLISRLLEKRPEDRVQTARDVFNELRHIQKRADSGAARPPSSGKSAAAPADNLWIAVLPFTVRGADPDSEAMAAGISDDLSAGLAKFSGMAVVAAQSTRAFKDSPLDIRQIAERLSARYVIAGSVRKAGLGIRITAQLIDAQSGAQLWNETYDRALADGDPFAIQDDVTDRIVATVADQSGVLSRSMVRAVRRDLPWTEHTSRELLLRTWGLQHNPAPDEHADVRAAIEARLAAEPDHSDLWAELAHLYLDEHILGLNPLPDPLGRAMRVARRAIEINPNHQRGWNELAGAYFFRKDRGGFFDAAEHALRINPRNAHSMAWMGNLITHAGEFERGSALSERAMAINPNHAGWAYFAVFNRHYAAGEFQDALKAARRVNMSELSWMHLAIAAAAANLGVPDEARRAAEKMLQLSPQLEDPNALREFVERWYWQEAMVDALVEGTLIAMGARGTTTEPSSTVRSNDRQKPPSSASGSARGGSLTVAVLPFVPRSSDDESKALADGLTDDITSGLSRFGYLQVLSRSIAERLAREHAAIHMQARYAIEGSVRKAGSTIRVGVTLVDTQTGTNLWTSNFDRDAMAGTFSLQDDVASAAVATIGDQTGVLVRAMAASMADTPIDRLSVAELVIRYHLYAEAFRPDEHLRLRDAFERALEKEPRVTEGWACLAMLCEHEHGFGLNRKPDPLGRQRHAAERAVELDPRSQLAWIALASVHGFARDREATRGAIERAVSINPLNADMVALGALFLSMAGEHDRAHALVSSAMARKPQHAGWYHYPMCHYFIARGDFEAALREIKAVNMPMMPLSHLAGAAVSGHLGRANEARAALAALRQISPALAEPDHARALWGVWIWDERFIDTLEQGLSKAIALAETQRPPSSDAVRSTEASIAVLPFTDLSEKKDQDWFCDGIAEEILNALAPLPGLRVAARASAFSLRGKTDDLRSIAEKLNVTTVLEGSVRRAGDRVRITAQLSDAREGRQIWSERFDRDMQDIFDVQEEIARAIVGRLRVTITGGAERLVHKTTTNIEAYELMLKGRVFLNRRGPAIVNAIECFEKAIALDPNLADAHAGLGDTYRLFFIYGVKPAAEAVPLARASLERALAIEPDQIEALATLANLAHVYDWNYAAAAALIDRALAREPSHVRALAESAITLANAMVDTPSDALKQRILERIRRARALDPLSAWAMALEALVLDILNREPEALELANRAVATDPNNFTAHWARLATLTQMDRVDEAQQAAQPGLAMSGRHPMLLSELATMQSLHGDAIGAEAIYRELVERAGTAYIGPASLAVTAAAAGHMADARTFLAKAIAARDSFLSFHRLPAFRSVWADPECAAMLRNSALMQGQPR